MKKIKSNFTSTQMTSIKLENENIKDERLIAHYREYLRKFASAEHAGEIRDKYETLNTS